MALYKCTYLLLLKVTCDSAFANTTISCTNGTTTLSHTCPSSSPYVTIFSLPSAGNWTISGTYDGRTTTITQTISLSTSIDLHAIPQGSTITPVNDIQTWLHCANIWDKSYTTINEVLSDTTTLSTLITNNNASDYMARSTSWASTVCGNSTAMADIGQNNYCSNKLLADSTWSNAICASSYFESVLTTKVPTMTSNNTPSGVASASSQVSGYEAYKAFDNNGSTQWIATSQVTGITSASGWVKYKFPQKVCVKKIFTQSVAGNFWTETACTVYGSNDDSTYTAITTSASSNGYRTLTNNNYYQYYRINITQRNDWAQETLNLPRYATIQLYGRQQ